MTQKINSQDKNFKGRGVFTREYLNKFLTDPRISYQAKGMLAYLLINRKAQFLDIMRHAKGGTKSYFSATDELRKAGYIGLSHFYDKDGRLVTKISAEGQRVFKNDAFVWPPRDPKAIALLLNRYEKAKNRK